MPNLEDIRNRIETEDDFINVKRFEFSLKKLLERYPEGAPPKVVAQALLMTEEEVEVLMGGIIEKLRKIMKVEDGETLNLPT